MKLSKLERETIVLFNEAEAQAEIYTFNEALQKQLAGLCALYPDKVSMTQEGRCKGQSFTLPKKWVRVMPPRVLSPAQREVLDKMNRRWKNST